MSTLEELFKKRDEEANKATTDLMLEEDKPERDEDRIEILKSRKNDAIAARDSAEKARDSAERVYIASQKSASESKLHAEEGLSGFKQFITELPMAIEVNRCVPKDGTVGVTKRSADIALAKKVAQLSKIVRGIKQEVKYIDLSASTSNISFTNGYTFHMSAIPQGAGVNQRISENIQVTHVEFHLKVVTGGSLVITVNDNPSYRVYVVQDLQQIADTSPSVGDLVDQPGLPITQLYNISEQRRFRVLYDSKPQMLYSGSFGAAGTMTLSNSINMLQKFHQHFKKKVSIALGFNGVKSTDIQKNGIYLMVSTDFQGYAGVAVMDIVATSRVGFTDS